jgi:hypothetical protein
MGQLQTVDLSSGLSADNTEFRTRSYVDSIIYLTFAQKYARLMVAGNAGQNAGRGLRILIADSDLIH